MSQIQLYSPMFINYIVVPPQRTKLDRCPTVLGTYWQSPCLLLELASIFAISVAAMEPTPSTIRQGQEIVTSETSLKDPLKDTKEMSTEVKLGEKNVTED